LADIALVNASISDVRSVPLGVLWLEAALRAAGFKADCGDYQVARPARKPEPARLARFCLERPAPVLGLSVMCGSLPTVLGAVELIRQQAPGPFIVLGGPGVCDRPRPIMERFPVDCIVVGEGEVTLVRLLRALRQGASLRGIPGLWCREAGRVGFTGPPPRAARPDTLPVPDWGWLDLEDYGRTAAIVTQRGCPYHCRFCSAHSVWGRRVTRHDISGVVSALLPLRGRVDRIEIHDDTFSTDPRRAAALLEALRGAGMDLPWACNCRADLLAEGQARELARLGCREVLIGVESGSDRVLRLLGKRVDAATCRRAVRAAADAVGKVTSSYIWGLPGETIEDLGETLLAAADDGRRPGVTPQLGLLSPLPGSPLGRATTDLELDPSLNPAGLFPSGETLADYPELARLVAAYPDIFSAFYYIPHEAFADKLELVRRFCARGRRPGPSSTEEVVGR